LQEFSKYLIKYEKNSDIDLRSAGLFNKYYESFILSKNNAFKILDCLRGLLKQVIIYPGVSQIEKVNGKYKIILEDQNEVESRHIVIASGRDYSIVKILLKLGQIYTSQHELLFGCRATFDPKTAESLFEFQPDSKSRTLLVIKLIVSTIAEI